MKRYLAVLFVSLAVIARGAVPTVSGVTFTQLPSKVVSVRYSLADAPAIITFDCLTNGVALSRTLLTNAVGEVNRMVGPGVGKEILWKVRGTLPERLQYPGVSFRVTAWATNCPPPYMAVDLTERNGAISYYASAEAVPGGVTDDRYKTDVMLFKKVEARNVRWQRGCNPEYYWASERASHARHYVTLSDDYYLGVYEYTVRQDTLCTGTAPSESDRLRPRGSLSYNNLRGTPDGDFPGWPAGGHAVKADSRIGLIRNHIGLEVDLPTEAQWEYACRAGTPGPCYYEPNDLRGDAQGSCANYAWIKANVGDAGLSGVQPVGQWNANPWGFYDMYGNAGEWCLDWNESWAPASYAKEQIDPAGPMTGTARAFRGGHIADGAGYANSIDRRYALGPSTGYGQCGCRLACPVVVPR